MNENYFLGNGTLPFDFPLASRLPSSMRDSTDVFGHIKDLIHAEKEWDEIRRIFGAFLRQHKCVFVEGHEKMMLYRSGEKKAEDILMHTTFSFPAMVAWILNNLDTVCHQYFVEPSDNIGVGTE